MSMSIATRGIVGQKKTVQDVQPSTSVPTKDGQVKITTADTSNVKIKVGG